MIPRSFGGNLRDFEGGGAVDIINAYVESLREVAPGARQGRLREAGLSDQEARAAAFLTLGGRTIEEQRQFQRDAGVLISDDDVLQVITRAQEDADRALVTREPLHETAGFFDRRDEDLRNFEYTTVFTDPAGAAGATIGAVNALFEIISGFIGGDLSQAGEAFFITEQNQRIAEGTENIGPPAPVQLPQSDDEFNPPGPVFGSVTRRFTGTSLLEEDESSGPPISPTGQRRFGIRALEDGYRLGEVELDDYPQG